MLTIAQSDLHQMARYYVHSGEGTHGTWSTCESTEYEIRNRLERERCSGDRWAAAYADAYKLDDGGHAGYDVETGEVKPIPSDVIVDERNELS